jgi:hypothetical protein
VASYDLQTLELLYNRPCRNHLNLQLCYCQPPLSSGAVLALIQAIKDARAANYVAVAGSLDHGEYIEWTMGEGRRYSQSGPSAFEGVRAYLYSISKKQTSSRTT